ncbi:MAG: carbon storage regulator CsrA [Firmicutes bacterium]|jgi:carbon storage regulator|uniref:Translational regulator CsrA n=1 Tax=Sulfobacillus benefaciens TaxID=453960 RepID=A0A2T2X6K1_9FIRM|nr:carbon storage regulator CsrA [Bacillota bacterium]MCL5015711.1 carbon storage regulator CsrA [Bacillota bacterium]PSR30134.1 MAG: carbon storage regulator [Sulfobacillus benefaciens]HBQ95335.1 carbon storage regulator [Sulfobacillus sp.]
MLVLSRKIDESLIIGNGEIRIVVLGIQGDQVKLGIDAPRHITVMREELFEAQQHNQMAAISVPPQELDNLKPSTPKASLRPPEKKPKSP